MAYQAKRHKKIIEDFELMDERGKVVETLHVSLDADDMIVNISRKYTVLTKMLADLDAAKKEANDVQGLQNQFAALGMAVADLIETVFGTKDAKTIVEFYENRYTEMAQEVLPFISTVVLPRLNELRAEKRQEMAKKYNRRQRRLLGLR